MRVSLVSHAYTVGTNQEKAVALSAHADVQVIAPSVWRSRNGDPLRRARPASDAFTFSACRVASAGRSTFVFDPIALGRALRRFDPDIVQIEIEAWTPAAAEVVALALAGKRALVGFTWESQLRGRGLRTAVDRTVLRRYDALVAGNQRAVEVARLRGYAGDVTVAPQFGVRARDPLEVTDARAKGGARRGELGLEGFVVGFVGRLVPEKGIGDLLGALRGLDDVSGLVVGGGPELDAVRGGGLVAVGPVPHEEAAPLIGAMDVLVLPSRTTPRWEEQFGHVLVEAMALGVPVVGSDSGAIPEVIGDAGLVFPEGEVAALRDRIVTLRDDPAYRDELASRGLARVYERFSHEHVAGQLVAVFDRVLAA